MGLLTLPVVAITIWVWHLMGSGLQVRSALSLWGMTSLVLFLARWGAPIRDRPGRYVLPWTGAVLLLCGLLATVWYGLSGTTLAAWIVLLIGWSVLFLVGNLLRRPGWLSEGLTLLCMAGVGGGAPVLLTQIQSAFAEEEFFVALQALVLTIFIAGLWLSHRILICRFPPSKVKGIEISRAPVLLALVGLLFLAGASGVRAYRHSFYAYEVPDYPGIEPESPFVCGEVSPDATAYDGVDVFARLLARVAANPRRSTPEYGMLALGTGKILWAERFRASILEEAVEGRFTGPAHSVKYIQYEASMRVYYFPRVNEAFPHLFSVEDVALLRGWFAAINERALTVEWVDLLYSLAFSMWPEGPYENQENGAGLLALLESQNLAPPHLHEANISYLERNRRGWNERFRNTDDAYVYQFEWINNAYYQALYAPNYSQRNQEQSFEWLLLQALPDGERFGYNHIGQPSLAGVAYLGATLLQDPRYVWLAGRSLDALEDDPDGYLRAQPGVEAAVDLTGRSPTRGSCLLYGDSGLPNQLGPLAPDKLVLRDGWAEDAMYMLVNLRFTGWHRYKASNSLTLAYRGQSLLGDVAAGRPFDWLPEGRSLFRDKRIPRENLSGLLIPRAGLGAVLHTLTGIGSPWAQDPPHYATVESFDSGIDLTYAHLRLADWNGWQHDRQVHFPLDGQPIVIVDHASGPAHQRGALVWHLAHGARLVEDRVYIQQEGGAAVEMVWIPLGYPGDWLWEEDVDGTLTVRCTGLPGQLHWALIVLRDDWVGVPVTFDTQAGVLEIGSRSLPVDDLNHR